MTHKNCIAKIESLIAESLGRRELYFWVRNGKIGTWDGNIHQISGIGLETTITVHCKHNTNSKSIIELVFRDRWVENVSSFTFEDLDLTREDEQIVWEHIEKNLETMIERQKAFHTVYNELTSKMKDLQKLCDDFDLDLEDIAQSAINYLNR